MLADCFPRLPRMEPPSVGGKEQQGKGKPIDFHAIKMERDDIIIDDEAFCNVDQLIDETYNIRKIVPYKGPDIATE